MTVTIRRMTAADLDPAVTATLDGGWGDRRSWYEFALGHRACDPLVAVDEDDGAVVATGTGTRNGASGWIGTIFVVPSRRRQGLGLAVSAAVCDGLEASGCRTLLLVATDAGRGVYERLGFAEDGWYRTFETKGTGDATGQGETTAEGEAAAGVPEGVAILPGRTGAAGAPALGRELRPFGPADIDEAAALDREATGEDRRHLIEAFAAIPRGLALRSPSGELCGFVERATWGGGATIARTVADAEALLEARRASVPPGHPVRSGLLESNEAGIARLRDLGWSEVRRMIRMRRGPGLDWRPERIWGQFNFGLG